MPSLMQLSLFDLLDAPAAAVTDAIEKLASNSGTEGRGAVFTRIEVVDFILDLVGYTINRQLHLKRILEPSSGAGDFLLPIIGRLLASWKKDSEQIQSITEELGNAIRAVELHRETYDATRNAVIDLLNEEGASASSAVELADRWLVQGDFLLEKQEG